MPILRSSRSLVLLAIALLVFATAALLALRGTAVSSYHIEERPLVQRVVATGRVIAPSRARIGSEITGVVRERRVGEGDRVAPDDPLLILRDEEFIARLREAEAALERLVQADRPQARIAVAEAEARLAQAERETHRRRELFGRGLIAAEALELAERAETVERAATERARLTAQSLRPGGPEEALLRARVAEARVALSRTLVRTGASGTVLTRAAEPGDLVQPGQILFEIALDGAIEISVDADERNLAHLATGQQAQCLTDAYPERPFPATLYFISPIIDIDRGTVELRLRVDDPPAWLRQDMTVTVGIETARRESALAIPDDALQQVGNGHASVLVAEDGRARAREVRLGLRGGGMSEVMSGLSPGERVIVDPVPAGTRVRLHEAAHGMAPDQATRRELPAGLN